MSIEKRWSELLESLDDQHRSVPNFSIHAQYALVVPGTSLEVKGLFSIINGICVPVKGQLENKKLEALLDIKSLARSFSWNTKPTKNYSHKFKVQRNMKMSPILYREATQTHNKDLISSEINFNCHLWQISYFYLLFTMKIPTFARKSVSSLTFYFKPFKKHTST